MDARALHTLDYEKVIAQITSFAATPLGKEKVKQLSPLSNLEKVQRSLEATAEGRAVLQYKSDVPFGGIRDIRPYLKRANIGAVLSPEELLDIASTIAGARRLKRFLLNVTDETDLALPVMVHWAGQITELKQVQASIAACIDARGEVVDQASDELRRIRAGIRRTEREIREKLEHIIRSSRYAPMLQEAIVTLRGDRYVIPVKQAHRTQFGGIVHDQSASGATVFIEPRAVVSLNHKLREWQLKEEREIERLLRELSRTVATAYDALQVNVQALAELDFIFAKAAYAMDTEAARPRLNDSGVIRLKGARHPLIPKQEVVPIDVELGDQFTTLVVTGPNTGGKTVALKTIGLLTLMAMSGLYIPAEDGSEMAVFKQVFADIGDEQSIEQNLSTFSGHMTNIIRILGDLGEGSLILLDELGAGTDPTEGAALAIALLDHIHQHGCRIVATTHYNELKAYAYNRENVMNGSVEFDIETLKPTYRLRLGVPGRSNALAIAERLGMPAQVIDKAKKQLSTDVKRAETMIAELEENRKAAEEDRRKAAALKREMETLRRETEREYEKVESARERLRKQAAEEARDIVKRAQREANDIIQELRKWRAGQVEVKEHQLIDAKKRLDDLEPERDTWRGPQARRSGEPEKEPAAHSLDIRPGDEVFVQSFKRKGHVVQTLEDGELQVQLGVMKVNVPRHDVRPIKTPSHREKVQTASVTRAKDHIALELDLRGLTVEEAVREIDKYMDDAVLAGLNEVTLIHGKGTGALRTGTHAFLRSHRHVKSFRLGREGEGASGVTVVQLK